MPMTLEEARKIIGTTGSSMDDVNAANAFLNEQAGQYGINPAKLMSGDAPAASPPSRDYPTGNPALSPSYDQGVSALGKNPIQWGSDATAQQLADWLGGSVVPHGGSAQGDPFFRPAQNMIDINGQLFNAGMIAHRFNNLTPALAMRTMSDEIAAETGQAWTPPTATPLWSEAANHYESAGSDARQMSSELAESFQRSRNRRPTSSQTNPADGGNRGSQPGPGGPGSPGVPDFPVSTDRDFDFPTNPYNPGPDPDRNLPPGFDPYATPNQSPRRPRYDPRSAAFGATR